ncbi:MAG: serine/threonine protein kinase [Planctomycetes bacterium]|nr:serine/threonine protein kinase [Planctomycetota bacterium]
MSLTKWFKSLFGAKPKKGPVLPRIDLAKRFEFLNRTGQGSMSKVWRARDRSLGRIVCVKVLDKVKTKKFEDRFPGLHRPTEGAICLGLRHQNIVQTFEHGMSKEGEPYLVMELIDGMGLNYLIETHSPQLEGNRINYLMQVADALEYLHNQGFLHRDVCPRNVMVTKEGLVKLIDFGLAVPNTPEFRRPGNRTGTPNYLAPEIIRRSTTDQRVDLFALGVTAYEVFTHILPWEKAQSHQTLLSHMNSAGKDPQELRPDLDKPTRAFLIKGIERDANLRFQTIAEFRDALKRLPKQDW